MNGPRRISRLAVVLHVVLLRPFIRLFSGLNITGREHLDDTRQFVIMANHNSHLDILLLFTLLPIGHIHRTHAVAEKVYFSKSRLVFRLVSFFFRPIWLVRGKPDIAGDPLGELKAALEAGDNLIIFPEGTRGEPGKMLPFKSGIGRLVTQYPHIPIVPVHLTGPERGLPKASALLLPIWNNVIVGPQQLPHGSHREATRHLETLLTELAASESARRHRRKPHESRRLLRVAFLGIDGSGKSTASRRAAEALSESARVGLISDELTFFVQGRPENLQPLITERLRRVVGGYAKTAKSLKLYKIPKLAELLLRDHLLRETARWYTPDVVVLDGSPLLNLLAWSVLYKKDAMDRGTCSVALGILSGLTPDIGRRHPLLVTFPELRYLKRLGLTKMALPDVVIFIDLPPSESCSRIEARGEPVQVHENEEKLTRLRDAYLQVCDVVEKDWQVPTAILDGRLSREQLCQAAVAFIRQANYSPEAGA